MFAIYIFLHNLTARFLEISSSFNFLISLPTKLQNEIIIKYKSLCIKKKTRNPKLSKKNGRKICMFESKICDSILKDNLLEGGKAVFRKMKQVIVLFII